jgi:hypothetical protein
VGVGDPGIRRPIGDVALSPCAPQVIVDIGHKPPLSAANVLSWPVGLSPWLITDIFARTGR